MVWFVAIALAGLMHCATIPACLPRSIRPMRSAFVSMHGHIGLVTLGAVFLVVTGGEALYADLGHFGRKPIQTAWFGLVLPALLINYFGQGALVLAHPAAIENPFYRLVPESLLLPMVVLATAATVIASQAVITGAYSLVRQAIQLGLLPRLAIVHTSAAYSGQIYLPRVNAALLVGVLLLVGLFRTSSALASAYGIAVTTTMVVDGLLGLHRDLEAVALAALEGGAADGAADRRRLHVLLGQPAQAAGRRLGAAAVRRRHGAADPDLAARHAHPRQQDAQDRSAARDAAAKPGEEAAACGAGHGRVPHQRSGLRADRAAAQSQAQQGAARAQRHPDHRHRRHAAGARRTSG